MFSSKVNEKTGDSIEKDMDSRSNLKVADDAFAEPPVRFHACRRCAESRNVNDVVIYLHFVQTVLTDVRSRSSRPNRHRADNRFVTLTIKKHPPKGGCLFCGAESRNRTGTGAKSQQILSLLRLPVPPYPLHDR